MVVGGKKWVINNVWNFAVFLYIKLISIKLLKFIYAFEARANNKI